MIKGEGLFLSVGAKAAAFDLIFNMCRHFKDIVQINRNKNEINGDIRRRVGRPFRQAVARLPFVASEHSFVPITV